MADIFIHAAQIRADFPSLKMPDAIHLAMVLPFAPQAATRATLSGNDLEDNLKIVCATL